MKKLALTLVLCLMAGAAMAQFGHGRTQTGPQSHLIFRGVNGCTFTLIVDGQAQNQTPAVVVPIKTQLRPNSSVHVEVIDGDIIRGRVVRLRPAEARGTYLVEYDGYQVYAYREGDARPQNTDFQQRPMPPQANGMAGIDPGKIAQEEIELPGPMPMAEPDFNRAYNQLKDEHFDDSRLNLARTIAASNFFTTDQILLIDKLFSFSEGKLEFAKLAYSRCVDPQNYYLVVGGLTFDSDKQALNEFIQQR